MKEFADYLRHLIKIKNSSDIYIYSRDQIGNYYSILISDLLLQLGIETDFNLERSGRNSNWFSYLSVIKKGKLIVENIEKNSVKTQFEDENAFLLSTRWSKKYKNLEPVFFDKKSRKNLWFDNKKFRGLVFVVYIDGKFAESKAFDNSWENNEITFELSITKKQISKNYYSEITHHSYEFPIKQLIIDLIVQGNYEKANNIVEDIIFRPGIHSDWVYEYYIGMQIEHLRNRENGIKFYQDNKQLISSSANIHKFIKKYDDKHLMSKLLLAEYFDNNKSLIEKIASNISENTSRFSKFPVFVYWGQGFDNLPPIIEATYKRLCDVVPSDALVSLSEDNIREFIQIPDAVDKIRNYSYANYSDYLRFAILAKYGGAWIDATVFVREDFYDQLIEYNQQPSEYSMDGPIAVMGSWFRVYKQSSHLGEKMLQATTLFWLQKFDKFPFYFFIDFLEQYYTDFKIKPGKKRDSFNTIVDSSFKFRDNLSVKFDEKWAVQLLKHQLVHKLNYKLSDWNNLNKEDSLYNAIISRKYPFD